jgi:phthiocerol/phenolphthiocerol synthesis type-I polyketide synthase E
MTQSGLSDTFGKIAVVGMVCRFPGSRNTEEYWENLRNGKECITFSSEQELIDRGIDPRLVKNPHFVRAYGVYEGTYLFDAPFFGFTPREGELLDPQQRVFLECAWEALETAGYDPSTYSGRIGLFAGASHSRYLVQMATDPAIANSVGMVTLIMANEKDFLATRVGYKLNLKGPCVTVQSACSTSLVGIIMACQNLLNYQSDMAMAGGIALDVDHLGGYYHEDGGIVSPDGHCRAFDAAAKGTVPGSGVGVVVLKRLEDALADGDTIHAVIIGSGMNNDGSAKAGFTAPSIDGQVGVFLEAITMAGINPETVNYVECHGTGTPIGDPIEIASLTKAFRAYTDKKGFCAVGSAKSNVGHADAAAGVAGFIKAVLALKHQQIPPTLHVTNPNPAIHFEETPFYVSTALSEWKSPETSPRRAGQNSFGIGGTNAHVLLEEAPVQERSKSSRPCQLLVWSARTDSTLETMTANLGQHLQSCPEDSFADLAFTLQTGRALFSHRRMLVCRDREDALPAFDGSEPERLLTAANDKRSTSVAFLFPGQGAQYVDMGRELYELEAAFREQVDLCAELAKPHLGYDIRDLLYPSPEQSESRAQLLNQTVNTQPAIFVIEYALAKLWMKWGVKPDAMIGHSIGEYVAACLAGVFTLEEALSLVAARGRMMQELPPGAMLSIMLPEQDVLSLLQSAGECSIAAINAHNSCVVAGPISEIERLEQELGQKEITCRRLQTSHAFHSSMMDPILGAFRKLVEKVKLRAPQLRYVSNLTGTWITAADATDPDYWVRHLRHTVRYADGAGVLLQDTGRVLLEVGPGRTLSSLVARHPQRQAAQQALASLTNPETTGQSDLHFLLTAMGRLWLEGVTFDWTGFYENEKRGRVPAPTYPFERQTYRASFTTSTVVRDEKAEKEAEEARLSKKKQDVADWFYSPSWKRSAPRHARPLSAEAGSWLLFLDSCGVGLQLAERLNEQGHDVISVLAGKQFRSEGQSSFTIDPGNRDHYVALVAELRRSGKALGNVAHLWTVTPEDEHRNDLESVNDSLNHGFYSLLFLAQALGPQYAKGLIQIYVVANNVHDVSGEKVASPVKATVLGPSRSIPREYRQLRSRVIDVSLGQAHASRDQVVECLLAEFSAESTDDLVAYRGGHRWTQVFEPFHAEASTGGAKLRDQGVYLITGGLGGIGLLLAEYLASTVKAKLALFGRSHFPEKNQWKEWLVAHDANDRVSEKIRRTQAMEALGAEVMVCSADVADREQMQEVMERVKAQFGAIHGVIHAAGVPGNGIIDLKTHDTALEVLAPKVHGTLVLDELLQEEQLDFFILCSSLTAFFGAAGQSDYTAANAFLDAFAHSRRESRKNVPVAINWDRWNEAGMAVDALGTEQKGPVEAKPAVISQIPQNKSRSQSFNHPVFKAHYREGEAEIFSGYVTSSEQWFIGEHRVKGIPTLVGTSYLELARSVFARKMKHAGAVELRDVLFLTPLMMQEGERNELQLVLKPSAHGYDFLFKSSPGDGTWREHAMGRVGPAQQSDAGDLFDLSSLLGIFGADAAAMNQAPLKIDDSYAVQVGPRWQCLMSISERPNEGLALLKLPEQFADDLENFELHPALLDSATSFALARAVQGGVYLPCSYERLVINKPLTRELYCYARYTAPQGPRDEILTVDVDILDANGEILVAVSDYSFKRVPETTLKVWDQATAASAAPANGSATAQEKKETPFGEDAWGILSQEGVEAFVRCLTVPPTPQVAIASLDLNWMAAKMKSMAEPVHSETENVAATLAAAHPRPNLPTPYVAPRTGLEQSIAEIWQSLLGVTEVGVHDDFIELGGHSLLAVQMISRIRELFEIDLPTAKLYENPTVAGLAEAVVQAIAAQSDNEKLMLALQEVQQAAEPEAEHDSASLNLK